jgi:hypothetical protein
MLPVSFEEAVLGLPFDMADQAAKEVEMYSVIGWYCVCLAVPGGFTC